MAQGGTSFAELLTQAVAESTGGAPQQETEDSRPQQAEIQIQAPEKTQETGTQPAGQPEEARYVEVKDDDGTTRRIKIDPTKSVEELWKLNYSFQKGMRKYQAERDKLAKAGGSEAAAKWAEVKSTFDKSGVEGLINLLSGEQDGYGKFVKGLEEKAVRRALASEDELQEMTRAEQLEQERLARIRAEKEKDDFIKSANQKDYEAKRTVLQSRIETAFDKYSLEGKLGNPEREMKLNDLIWRETLGGLEKYAQEKGITEDQIPPQVIHQMFKDQAEFFGGTITELAEKKAGDVVERKKVEATKAAQARSTTAAPSRETVEELAEKYMGKYDSGGFFKQMFSSLGR